MKKEIILHPGSIADLERRTHEKYDHIVDINGHVFEVSTEHELMRNPRDRKEADARLLEKIKSLEEVHIDALVNVTYVPTYIPAEQPGITAFGYAVEKVKEK